MFSKLKGWLGEKTTQAAMWIGLNSEIYERFHNLTVPVKDGTTQIDHVLLSKYGIFVIETKNYKGWIYGDQRQKTWTQVLHRRKFKFQNPLHQNYMHTRALSDHLGIDHDTFIPVVFFVGDAVLKTELPPNVMNMGLFTFIESYDQVVFTDQEIAQLRAKFKALEGGRISTQAHVQNINKRYASDTTCPKCGKPLIERTAQKGPNAGQTFLGCSRFPACRYTKKE